MELSLPCSLAGLAIAEPLRLDHKVDGVVVYMIELVRVYFMLTLKFVIQLYFIALIYKHGVDEGAQECVQDLAGLTFICVFVFLCAIFSEIRHSFGMLTLLYNAEHKEDKSYTGLGSEKPVGAVMVAEKTGKLAQLQKKYRPAPPPDMPQWTLHKISIPYKILSVIIVVLPKIFIAVYLGYAGAIFIAQCKSTEDMVLNTLAVNFVVDVDMILYETFTSDATKSSMEHAEGVEVPLSNRERVGQWVFNTVIYPLLVISTSWFLVHEITECEHPSFGSIFSDIKVLFLKGDAHVD